MGNDRHRLQPRTGHADHARRAGLLAAHDLRSRGRVALPVMRRDGSRLSDRRVPGGAHLSRPRPGF
ncbi:MAG: hypothetical protein ACK559_15800, partial [bacterium]